MTEAALETAYRDRAVLVTGGAGFIGSHVCEALVEAGAHVTVMDDFSQGREANLASVRDAIRLVRGSILDTEALRQASEGVEIVFHQAALTSVPRSLEEPRRSLEVNGLGTMRVVEAARAAGARGVVYASSSSVYGDQPRSPKVESMPPDPCSPYAAAKSAGEQLLRAAVACSDLAGVSLRYFNIFGPRQRADSPYAAVIPRWAEAMRRGEPVTIYGDGAQSRDFTHVTNAVRANLLAGARIDRLEGQVINVACGRSITVLELARRLAALLDQPERWTFAPARRGEVLHSHADISAARALLGYEPITTFETGLRALVEADGAMSG